MLPDMSITNEWFGNSESDYSQPAVVFGNLKKNSNQGVAELLSYKKNGEVLILRRFLCPKEYGSLKVIETGSKVANMEIKDEKNNVWLFDISNGFLTIQ